MPKAHMYWTKNPRASHWDPSQKFGLSPGSSGITNPSSTVKLLIRLSPSVSAVPFHSCISSSSCSLVVTGPVLRFLLSNFPVLEEGEDFLGVAETVKGNVLEWWDHEGDEGLRNGRRRMMWEHDVLLGVLQRILLLLLARAIYWARERERERGEQWGNYVGGVFVWMRRWLFLYDKSVNCEKKVVIIFYLLFSFCFLWFFLW